MRRGALRRRCAPCGTHAAHTLPYEPGSGARFAPPLVPDHACAGRDGTDVRPQLSRPVLRLPCEGHRQGY
ncbi:hypothetical protein GCM10009549_38720 [Streptomyces thermoalcalitolerans]|uniref:Uncharacterized protein n=1 Tax=Streptomyces thermoalcalitolerans TaxID=65605 RepID=A0ABN1NZN9_9ACTN